jgi:UDP-N-acetylglucosamine--dolichyl-phosphate N-acetylglucosaminephosphotransferase
MISTIFPFLLIGVIGFLVSLFLIPYWIRKAEQIGLVWEDMNKIKKEKVAGSGGFAVVLGFILCVLAFVAYRVFVLKSNEHLIEVFALLTVILISTGIGLIDDLLGWQKGGLSKRSRLILLLFAAIPLIVINAGKSQIGIPLLGSLDIGLLYPLIIIPLGIVGATATFNFLAGFNGLEAGQGIIILTSSALVAYLVGNSWLSIIALCMVFPLIAFLIFNFYPAKIFPGDTLTYAVGSLIATLAILGNFEKVALFFFIPYVLEVVLKSRGRLNKYSFGKPNKDGSLDLLYPKIYGLTHLSILIFKKLNIKPTEKRVVYLIWAFQILIIVIGFIIFRNRILIK